MKFSSGFNYRVACLKACPSPPPQPFLSFFFFKHGKLYQNFPRAFVLTSTISRFLECHKQRSLVTPFYQRVLPPTESQTSAQTELRHCIQFSQWLCFIFVQTLSSPYSRESLLILTVSRRDGTVLSLISKKEIKAIHTHAQKLLLLENHHQENCLI